jgi:N-sulfoglucosamine sulfohydrolase
VKPEDVEVPRWLTDLPETRQELVEYYKALHRTDVGVGLVYEALEKQGLLGSTLFVFTSDNGPPFINSKTTLYDAGIHLPLIIRQPGLAKPGIVNLNMISFVDLVPTFLDWAGLPLNLSSPDSKSPPRRGRSSLPILQHSDILPEEQWQHHVFGSHTFHEMQNYWPTRILRTRRYKYHRNIAWRLDFPFAADLYASVAFEGIRNMDPPVMVGQRKLKDYLFRPAEELYDMETDPDEVKNLAGSKEHEELLLKCREVVSDWQQETKDLWLFRDGQSATVLSRYAKDGLEVPDRLDFDVENPGTKGVEMTKYLKVDGYSEGIGK